MNDINVSIVIPVYNAADLIEDTVEKIERALDPLGLRYEILLRDDSSGDGSKVILERIARQNSRVRCSYNQFNEGLGFTLKKLFHHAKGEHVVYCDCDLPFGAEIIVKLLSKIQLSDIAVASRYAGISNHVQLLRCLFSRAYFLFCKILFNVPVVDVGSGSMAIRRKALVKLNFKMKGFGIHAEIYSQALRKGFLITEIPAKSYKNRRGSFSILRHGPKVALETIQFWFETLRGAY